MSKDIVQRKFPDSFCYNASTGPEDQRYVVFSNIHEDHLLGEGSTAKLAWNDAADRAGLWGVYTRLGMAVMAHRGDPSKGRHPRTYEIHWSGDSFNWDFVEGKTFTGKKEAFKRAEDEVAVLMYDHPDVAFRIVEVGRRGPAITLCQSIQLHHPAKGVGPDISRFEKNRSGEGPSCPVPAEVNDLRLRFTAALAGLAVKQRVKVVAQFARDMMDHVSQEDEESMYINLEHSAVRFKTDREHAESAEGIAAGQAYHCLECGKFHPAGPCENFDTLVDSQTEGYFNLITGRNKKKK